MGRRRTTEVAGEFTYEIHRDGFRVRYQSPKFDMANNFGRVDFLLADTVVIAKQLILHAKEDISKAVRGISFIYSNKKLPKNKRHYNQCSE